jgi:hypothetical protein
MSIVKNKANGNAAIIENTQTIDADYTIQSDKNAISAGSITISSGITITVASGARWMIV